MKFRVICLFWISLILLLLIIDNTCKVRDIETFIDGDNSELETVTFPFKNIKTEHNKNTNVIGIVAPFRNKDHFDQYEKLKAKGYKFLGICSYLQFPGKILNKYDPANKEDMNWYIPRCLGWLYCFRNPCEILPCKSIPMIQMSQSDFTNPNRIKPKELPIIWDFIYICLKDNDKCDEGWNSINRSWDLSKKCLNIMCLEYGLRGLIIGRSGCRLNSNLKKYLTFKDQLGYWEFIKSINQSKFTFLPNTMDASPRTLTESLCLNKPVLVNKNIIGGWKYVNKNTGEFFSDENDLRENLSYLLDNYSNYQPRKYFSNNYGPKIYGPKLEKFIRLHYPNFTKCTSAEPYCCD